VLTNDRFTDLAVAEIEAMAATCAGADPSTPVPTCPGWDLAELMQHTGEIHRWAATMVEQSSQKRLKREQLDWGVPADPADLASWLGEGAAFVEPRFRACDPSTPMWAWGWPKLAGFWPRRMVHETAVHRCDAAIALGQPPTVDAEVAIDGVEELLDNLPEAAYFAPHVAELKGDGEILVLATDGATWTIPLQPDGYSWVRDEGIDGDATLAVRSPTDLLLTLYHRRPPAPGEITGDAAIVTHWLTHSSI
jgi:uncharacterized protein (TIGR03083 family)